MNQLNSIILEGNITRDGEFKDTPHGFRVANFPIACNRWYRGSGGQGVDEVSYFDIETFGKMAEYCEAHVSKGRGVRVVGRLKQNRWKDANGKNASRVTIVAEHVEFKPLIGKKDAQKNENELKEVAEANAALADEPYDEAEADSVAF